MKEEIVNSIVAKSKSTINNAIINRDIIENISNDSMPTIKDSIVADGESQITGAIIDIAKVKKNYFWRGFVLGILTSVIGSAIWYFVQKIIEKQC
jgi:hypothetical protein